jgi:hypothetical protein
MSSQSQQEKMAALAASAAALRPNKNLQKIPEKKEENETAMASPRALAVPAASDMENQVQKLLGKLGEEPMIMGVQNLRDRRERPKSLILPKGQQIDLSPVEKEKVPLSPLSKSPLLSPETKSRSGSVGPKV